MGSSSNHAFSLPDPSSPDLVLTQPTDAERTTVWSSTHHMWGAALTHDDYLARERYLTTIPLAKDGGLTHWILTDATLPPDARPILSSCETLRKPAVSAAVSSTEGAATAVEVTDGIAHGIASVFTDPQFRGKGYASRMMAELGPRLGTWQADDDGRGANPLFSVLYSDIGKSFYAKNGWAPFASTHFSFPPVPASSPDSGAAEEEEGETARPIIGFDSLPELCAADEALLRTTLARRAARAGGPAVALVPSLDQVLWHMYREDFVTRAIFGRTPAVRGAVCGERPGGRVWALWMRGYYGGIDKIEGNTLHILRLVVEDEEAGDEYLARAVRSIVAIAQREAAEWKSADCQVWNPNEKLRGLIERSGVQCEFVDRTSDSIASLMWYGEGATADVDWVYNEKFAWC